MKSFSLIITLTFFSAVAFAQAGMLDSTFSGDGKVSIPFLPYPPALCTSEAIQSDGKILIAGRDSDNHFILMRFNTDGSTDYSFGNDGFVTMYFDSAYDNVISDIKIQTDGKIVVAGSEGTVFYQYHFVLVRFLSNGNIDSSFGTNGIVMTDFGGTGSRASSMVIQSDGKIVAAGYRYTTGDVDFVVARYLTDGSLDNSFNGTGKVITDIGPIVDFAYKVALQSDGKILVSGETNTSDTTGDYVIVRYLASGSLDPSFGTNGIVQGTNEGDGEYAREIIEQPDGNILIAGLTIISSYDFNWTLMRLKNNGQPDSSFGINGLITTDFADSIDIANSLILQPDGKILVGGFATIPGEQADVALIRYLSDGSPDSTFGVNGKVTTDFNGGADGGAEMLLQSDGKIVVCGGSRAAGNDSVSFILCRYLNKYDQGDNFIQDVWLSNEALLYPNPIHLTEQLEYTLTTPESLTISLYDANGKLIRNFISNEQRAAGAHKETLNIGELPSGNYFLTISNGAQKMTVKMVNQ
ncbi:MAG TPA: T9SS type A sorting domain-containing protein [Chitinophagales bacterium]|nr:T9SS type A sorting domain-containing protein [Chitinophagales bacterium]